MKFEIQFFSLDFAEIKSIQFTVVIKLLSWRLYIYNFPFHWKLFELSGKNVNEYKKKVSEKQGIPR